MRLFELVFLNALRNRLKCIYFDGSGLWVCAKRLEKGCFTWPEAAGNQTRVTLSPEEWALLVGGIDLAATRQRRWYRKAVTVEEKIL